MSFSKDMLWGAATSSYQIEGAAFEDGKGYPNFLISSGCDIPPITPWENIDAFFAAVQSNKQR